jgi:predicted ATPase
MVDQSGYLWRIHLFGGPTLRGSHTGNLGLSHFRSAKVAALLSYLALRHEKPCSREALIEALWPDESDFQVLANRFRVTLASLRKQLEPNGLPFGSVLDTSIPGCVALRKGATWCDVSAFEEAYALRDYTTASSLLSAPLVPGIQEEWVSEEQLRYELLRDELAPYFEPIPKAQIKQETQTNSKKHRLPLFLTDFISRESEQSSLNKLIESSRLVTVTGPAGVGKTRLTIEVASSSKITTVFIPLVDCKSEDDLVETILRHLSIGTQTEQKPLDQLLYVLATTGEIRLLLDNADHLLDGVLNVVEPLISMNPELRILISSRQALELDGEQVLRLGPLSFPVEESDNSDLEAFASTRLFVDRLRQSRPDFAPTEAQRQTICEICRRLDGLPLALELAAAQVTVQSISEILEQIKIGLTGLKSRRKTLSSNHQSLRVAVESSLSRLDHELARFLGMLSVFSGGFTVDHAESVTGDADAIERIENLVLRSLLSSDMTSEKMRFSGLGVVRQLARELLSQEEIESVQQKHSEHFLSLAAAVDENDLRTLRTLDDESLNLNLAFENADQTQDSFYRANRGAIMHAFIRGRHRTALPWINRYWKSVQQYAKYETACDWFNAALQVLPDIGLVDESNEILEIAERSAFDRDDLVGKTYCYINRGLLLSRHGDNASAVELHEKALANANILGIKSLRESALAHVSGSLHELGREQKPGSPERARTLGKAEETASLLINSVDIQSRRHPLARLLAGVAALHQDKLDESSKYLQEATDSAQRHQILSVMMYAAYFECEIARRKGLTMISDSKRKDFEALRDRTGMRWQEAF